MMRILYDMERRQLLSVFIIFLAMLDCLADDATEACGEVKLDIKGLQWDLKTKLYGQHLVTEMMPRLIKNHYNDPNPGKPLVLAFNGQTGGGKNFVTRMIRDHIYKGSAQVHYHLFNSEIHFKHESKVPEYKDDLHRWIYHNVSKCARSMFVFDELDHMPMRVLNVLTPFLGHEDQIDGVDFRKSVFIFLSNSGGEHIMNAYLKYLKDGNDRTSLKLGDVQKMLKAIAYHKEGGLKRNALIKSDLIDHFVPFLPMEEEHVKECILELVRQKYDFILPHEQVNEILDELVWEPEDEKLFSKSGCKKIETLVKLAVDKLGGHDEL